MKLAVQIDKLINQQTREWKLARKNYDDLASVEKRSFQFDDFQIVAQFNPGRIHSSAAKTDRTSISERPCFLCKSNRPTEQAGVDFQGKYEVLINPYPIFEKHLTIVGYEHVPQHFEGRLLDMLVLAEALPDFTLFYNGPKCGASAPDHFHFQAGGKNVMPVDREVTKRLESKAEQLANLNSTQVYALDEVYLRKLIVFTSTDSTELILFVERVLGLLPKNENDDEPMMNILANFENGQWQVLLFPRERQRPCQYFKEGSEQILMSPASVEMGGLAILPRREDFEKITSADFIDIYKQVSLNDAAFKHLKNLIKGID
ncbi:DUF4922 domain-containing protein [Mangrovibacterium diazotrophicum]|uniref:GDP-D-glucose phosphorylase 1 n=1 Tax=Mangrovibacterium diazotrophicum TaxID=1261403 RepID=A0A419WBS6_9BACT|nr:DUF4922 domain-containing protein [Mangrovibacterium diazotrophicum]RKD92846.1 uncharacterized protein DUF4922 [Mangrovibacterium diazotrophicum]